MRGSDARVTRAPAKASDLFFFVGGGGGGVEGTPPERVRVGESRDGLGADAGVAPAAVVLDLSILPDEALQDMLEPSESEDLLTPELATDAGAESLALERELNAEVPDFELDASGGGLEAVVSGSGEGLGTGLGSGLVVGRRGRGGCERAGEHGARLARQRRAAGARTPAVPFNNK